MDLTNEMKPPSAMFLQGAIYYDQSKLALSFFCGVTIQTIFSNQHFYQMVIILVEKVVVTFQSVNEIL